jgi:hypothetical protein
MKIFICDLQEFRPVIDLARSLPGVRVNQRGPYVEVQSEGPLVIDRRASGVGHAVWFSFIGGISGGRVVQFDSDALTVRPS